MRNSFPLRGLFRADDPDYSFDPLEGSAWSDAEMVAGFARSPANSDLLAYAARKGAARPLRVLDIGCGAGRNAVPLARAGHRVVGTDLSWPMVEAAHQRQQAGLTVTCAPMHRLPVRDRSFDLIVAHGIWNLAKTSSEFRVAIGEAARAAADGAALFVFTFSRTTIAEHAQPFEGESFGYTQFTGSPQIFLTADQLRSELAAVGFVPDPDLPLRELNVPPPGALRGPSTALRTSGAPVIFQAGFTFERP